MLAVAETTSRQFSSSRGWKDVVPAASDPTVTSRASAGRLLRTESQVRLTIFMSYRTITVTPSLFHTQALPLRQRRFLRPQNGRGLNAECPRHSPARQPWPCPVRDRAQSENSPYPRHDRVRVQSVTVFSPRPQPLPQSVHVRDRIRAANVRVQPLSVNNPCPCPVRSRAQSMTASSPCSWKVRDRVESSQCPRPGPSCIRAVDVSSPPIIRVCPHLIQTMSAKRCWNLLRDTNRSSRTCCRPGMSSSSCGRDGLRFAPSLNCSRNIVCQRARRPLLISVTKCWAKPSGHTAAFPGNGFPPSNRKVKPSSFSPRQPPLHPASRPTPRLPQIVHEDRA